MIYEKGKNERSLIVTEILSSMNNRLYRCIFSLIEVYFENINESIFYLG